MMLFAQEVGVPTVPSLSPDEALKLSAKYDAGTWTLSLIIIAGFVLLTLWWLTWGRFAAKAKLSAETDRTKAEDARRDAETKTRVAMGEVLVGMGQQQQQINTNVGRVAATGEELRAGQSTERRAWRIVADMADVLSDSGLTVEQRQAKLSALSARLHEVMDDDSRLMRALTDDDIARDLIRRQHETGGASAGTSAGHK